MKVGLGLLLGFAVLIGATAVINARSRERLSDLPAANLTEAMCSAVKS